MDRLTIWGLRLLGLIFSIVAFLGLLAPDLLFDPIGVTLATASGLAEIRAAYFGFFGASALLFFVASQRASLRKTALMWAGLVCTGFVFGRLVSLGLDGIPNGMAMANLLAETVGAIAAWVLWSKQRKTP